MYIVSYMEPWDNGSICLYGTCVLLETALEESEKFLRENNGYMIRIQNVHAFEFGTNIVAETHTVYMRDSKLQYL